MEFKGESKPRRREEGEERNKRWRTLTPAHQLDVLDHRPGESKRQRDKIKKVLEGK